MVSIPEFPRRFNSKTGKMEPVPLERRLQREQEQRQLEAEEAARKIHLKQDATFADLFDVIRSKGKATEDEFHLELANNFYPDIAMEIFGLMHSSRKVLDWFEKNGIDLDDVETYLPIKFEVDPEEN